MKLENAANLDLLEHVNPKTVERFIKEVNQLSVPKGKKLVLAVGTGGTIAMKITPEGKWVPDLDFEKYLLMSLSVNYH